MWSSQIFLFSPLSPSALQKRQDSFDFGCRFQMSQLQIFGSELDNIWLEIEKKKN
jgi:hypothetical protein